MINLFHGSHQYMGDNKHKKINVISPRLKEQRKLYEKI